MSPERGDLVRGPQPNIKQSKPTERKERGMTFKRMTAFSCLAAYLMIGGAACAASRNTEPQAQETLRKLFPKMKYTKFVETEIEGLYEVTTDGRIIYFHPKTGYLFVGDLLTNDGRSITQERMAAERFKLFTAEDLKKAIKIGHGKHTIIEITDPDCSFCRKMHSYWGMRNDVTRYIFFKPLDMHPDAVKKATYILAAPDTEKALFEVYSGKLDSNRAELDKPHDDRGRLAAQKEVVEKLQVEGTPTFWVDGKFVNGSNVPLIEKYIGKAPAK